MKFHPLSISVLKSFIKCGSNKKELVYYDSLKDKPVDEYTCSLITFKPSVQFNEQTNLLHVGDIFYLEDENLYFIFSLFKEDMYSKSIEEFGFYTLKEDIKHSERKELLPYTFLNYETMINSFDVEKLIYVGNIYLHEVNTFFKQKDEYLSSESLYENATTTNKILYNNNRLFLVAYHEDGNEYIDWFDELSLKKIFMIKDSEWNLFVTHEILTISISHPGLKAFLEGHNRKDFIAKTGTLFIGNELYSESLFKRVIKDEYFDKTLANEMSDSISYHKEFFVALGENGLIDVISLNKNIQKNNYQFIIPPMSSAYKKIEMSNDDEQYLKRYIEVIS